MRRVTITISDEVFDVLDGAAARYRRSIREQAAWAVDQYAESNRHQREASADASRGEPATVGN